MRVLLTDPDGPVGVALHALLQAAGHQAIPAPSVLDRAQLAASASESHVDAIVHGACAGTLPRARDLAAVNRLRSEGTSNVVAVARAAGIDRVVTLSCLIGHGALDHGADLLDETAPFGWSPDRELDGVLRSMVSNEQQVRAAGGIVLRTGILYGETAARVVPARWRGKVPIVHPVDVAEAIVAALERGKPGESYAIADESDTSWAELHAAIAAATGRPSPRAREPWALAVLSPFSGDVINRTSLRVSTRKAREHLGWRPTYPTFVDGLASLHSAVSAEA